MSHCGPGWCDTVIGQAKSRGWSWGRACGQKQGGGNLGYLPRGKITRCYGVKTHAPLLCLEVSNVTLCWHWEGALSAFERQLLTLLEWKYPESERKDDSVPNFRS